MILEKENHIFGWNQEFKVIFLNTISLIIFSGQTLISLETPINSTAPPFYVAYL